MSQSIIEVKFHEIMYIHPKRGLKLFSSFRYLKLKYISPIIIYLFTNSRMETSGSIKQTNGNVQAYLIHSKI